jgi:hypothetical protein
MKFRITITKAGDVKQDIENVSGQSCQGEGERFANHMIGTTGHIVDETLKPEFYLAEEEDVTQGTLV